MLNSRQIANKITSTEIPGDRDPQLQNSLQKCAACTSSGDINPDSFCMKQEDNLSNNRRNNGNSINNKGINIKPIHKNTENFVNEFVQTSIYAW